MHSDSKKEVTHEDQEGFEANRAGVVDLEGRLNGRGGGHAQGAWPPPPPLEFRLKRSLEIFDASDGCTYLLRSGFGDDFVLESPSRFERALLELLADGAKDVVGLSADLAALGLPIDGLEQTLADLDELGVVEQPASHPVLSARQRERYDRQLIYFSDIAPHGVSGEALQGKLSAASVAILGCGGLGSWVASGLACAGVGSLLLADDDRVELSNLNRQLLFTEDDVGELKVKAAARRLAASNADLRVVSLPIRVRGVPDVHAVIDRADLLITTADWPPYDLARWINECCLGRGTPYLSAGQFPPLVRVGPMVIPGESACHECLERSARREFPLYEELSTTGASRSIPPAATLGAASGLVGSMLAMEAIHFLTGAATPATLSRAIVVDLRSMRTTEEDIARDPSCPACGSTHAD